MARAAGMAVRFIVFVVALGIAGFALGGLLGIIMTSITNATGLTQQSMMAALWFFAIPGGVFGAIAGGVVTVLQEMRWNKRASGM